jgi:ATP-dependent DNA helicase RecG
LPENLKHKICILTGSVTKNEKIKINERIRSGEYVFVVGTHALIQKSVVFKNLAYIIIDEQHRFGVEQRKNLQAKSNSMPHVLHMTATPIPRSIALTLYGELDMSVLKHKPSNRQPVVTKLVVPDARQQIYTQVVEEIRKGRQAFVVCPLIQNNDEKSNRPLSVEEIATQNNEMGSAISCRNNSWKNERFREGRNNAFISRKQNSHSRFYDCNRSRS